MREIIVLLVHLLITLARLARPGGVRSVIAESVRIKHQLLILNRSRQRSPNLRASDRVIAGFCSLLIHRDRLIRSAIVLKPSTLMRLHRALKDRKYRLLFSPKSWKKPGPKGPGHEVIGVFDSVQDANVMAPRQLCNSLLHKFGVGVRKKAIIDRGPPPLHMIRCLT